MWPRAYLEERAAVLVDAESAAGLAVEEGAGEVGEELLGEAAAVDAGAGAELVVHEVDPLGLGADLGPLGDDDLGDLLDRQEVNSQHLLVRLEALVLEDLLYYFGETDVPDSLGIVQESLVLLGRSALAVRDYRCHPPLIIDLQPQFVLLDTCIKLLFVLNVQIKLGLGLSRRPAAHCNLRSGSHFFDPYDIFLCIRQFNLERIVRTSFFFSHEFKNQLQGIRVKCNTFVKELLCFSNFFCCLFQSLHEILRYPGDRFVFIEIGY